MCWTPSVLSDIQSKSEFGMLCRSFCDTQRLEWPDPSCSVSSQPFCTSGTVLLQLCSSTFGGLPPSFGLAFQLSALGRTCLCDRGSQSTAGNAPSHTFRIANAVSCHLPMPLGLGSRAWDMVEALRKQPLQPPHFGGAACPSAELEITRWTTNGAKCGSVGYLHISRSAKTVKAIPSMLARQQFGCFPPAKGLNTYRALL